MIEYKILRSSTGPRALYEFEGLLNSYTNFRPRDVFERVSDKQWKIVSSHLQQESDIVSATLIVILESRAGDV